MSRYAFGKLLSSQVSIFFLFPFCDAERRRRKKNGRSVIQCAADVRTFVQLENTTDWNAHERRSRYFRKTMTSKTTTDILYFSSSLLSSSFASYLFFSLAHRHTQNTFWCRQSLLSVCKWKVSRGVDGEHSTFSVSIFFRFVRFFLFTFEKRSRTTLCVCSIFSSAARQCISFSFILFSFLINGSVVRWIGIKAKFHCISLMETSASVSARKRERSRFVCVILSLKEICSHRCAHQKF